VKTNRKKNQKLKTQYSRGKGNFGGKHVEIMRRGLRVREGEASYWGTAGAVSREKNRGSATKSQKTKPPAGERGRGVWSRHTKEGPASRPKKKKKKS